MNSDFIECVKQIPSRYTQCYGPLVYGLVIAQGPQLIIETGTCHGYITAWLAAGAKDVGATVISIDYYAETHPHARPGDQDLTRQRLLACGVMDSVQLVAGDSIATLQEMSQQGRFSGCSLMMIDDNHNYAHVRTELDIAVPAMPPGAVIIMHDTLADSLPGVRQAMLEVCEQYGLSAVTFPGTPVSDAWADQDHSNGLTILRKGPP